jgi:uncharacterized membrane protein YcaP (DUF421 family)
MHTLVEIFGQGKELTTIQMSCRGLVVFFIALLLIRISGRRSFGIHSPLDNIITIALGAILSRAIVGASGFVPVVVCCTVIVLLHRVVGWMIVHNKIIERLVEGEKIILYKEGHFIDHDLGKALVGKEDILQGVRKTALTEDLEQIDKIYMEKNGEITVIRRSKE